MAILLLATAAAGILARAVPRRLAWPALVLGLAQLTPIGFVASMLFLLWAAVTGLVLTIRPFSGVRAARSRGADDVRAPVALSEH